MIEAIDIKFKFVFQHCETGRICELTADLALLEDARLADMPGWERIAIRQYTCLKDKNGVEIYEGDIVSSYLPNDFTNCRLLVADIKPLGEYSHFHSRSDFEVIGNIHQNPELLERDI